MITLAYNAVAEKAKQMPDGYFADVLSSGVVINNANKQPQFLVFADDVYKTLLSRWSAGTFGTATSASNAPQSGAGTQLKLLLAGWPFRIVASPDCKCTQRAAYMDAKGIDWCESSEGMTEILDWLRESAAERGLPFLDAAARLLVRRAIANARKAEAASAQRSSRHD